MLNCDLALYEWLDFLLIGVYLPLLTGSRVIISLDFSRSALTLLVAEISSLDLSLKGGL